MDLNIPGIPQSVVSQLTGISPHVQTSIVASKQPRTFHNQPDLGPDPRGRKKAIPRKDTAAICEGMIR